MEIARIIILPMVDKVYLGKVSPANSHIMKQSSQLTKKLLQDAALLAVKRSFRAEVFGRITFQEAHPVNPVVLFSICRVHKGCHKDSDLKRIIEHDPDTSVNAKVLDGRQAGGRSLISMSECRSFMQHTARKATKSVMVVTVMETPAWRKC